MRANLCLILFSLAITALSSDFLGFGDGPKKHCEVAFEVNCYGPKTLDDGTVVTRDDVRGCPAPPIVCPPKSVSDKTDN